MSSRKSEIVASLPFISTFTVVSISILLVTYGLLTLATRATFPGELAEIETVRVAAAHVDPAQSAFIIGQAVEKNRSIAEMKAMNATWYADWAIPDAWDEIQPIPIPETHQ